MNLPLSKKGWKKIGRWGVLEMWDLGREVFSWKTPRGPSRVVLHRGRMFLLAPTLRGLGLSQSFDLPPGGESRNVRRGGNPVEPKGKRQTPSPLEGSPTAVSLEGLPPVLGDEALEEILGPSKMFVEESAGGTLHCASCL